MDPLEQVRRHEVLEAQRILLHQCPVELIVLARLAHGPHLRRSERCQAKDGVESLEDRDPTLDGLVRDLQVFAQRIDRKRRADELGKSKGQKLEASQVMHALQRGDVLTDQPRPVLARPASRLDFGATQERLGKAAEVEQVDESRLPLAELREGERMESQQVIAPLQRVAAVTIEIEPAAAGGQNLLTFRTPVEEALQKAAPGAPLMDLVEDPDPACRQLALQNALAVGSNVPVEVARASARQASGEGGLPNLPRPGEEDHLPFEVGRDLRREVPLARAHAGRLRQILPIVKICRGQFHPWSQFANG